MHGSNLNFSAGHVIIQVVRHWLLTVEPQLWSWLTSHEIHGGHSGTQAGFSPSSFSFLLLIIISPLLRHYPLRCARALTRQHIMTCLDFQVWGFISDLALGWLESKEVSFFCDMHNEFNLYNKLYLEGNSYPG
jgi:hypothetical protein